MKLPWSKSKPQEPTTSESTKKEVALDHHARVSKKLREEADTAGDPPQPESIEPFDPKCGDTVLAPARHNPVVKEPAEVVELEWRGSERYAKVREPRTEAEPWSVHYESLEPLPAEPKEPSEPDPAAPAA